MSDIVKQVATAIGIEGVGRTVLVSGVTGFVGTGGSIFLMPVALEYIKHGFTVHATARSQEKADEWLSAHYIARLNTKFFIVKDVAEPGAFDEAIQGVEIVAHAASPFHYNAKDNEAEILKPAVQGTKSVLETAAKTPSVKRVVITSSFASVLDVNQGFRPGYTYSEKDYNPATFEEAKKTDNPAFLYCASKILAEQAAWDFVKEKSPGFALTTICPPTIFGPPHQVVKDLDNLNQSSAQVWSLINGSTKQVPETTFPVATDVRDIAKLHVLATTLDVAKNQRYLTIAFHYSEAEVAAILRKAFPENASRITPSDGKPMGAHYDTDSSKVQRDLGIVWTAKEQSIKDTAARLWEIEASLKHA
ncbi:MAG: methylglyoxal reductase (NADPH-dependent) gre2 [Cyphobasidiales sp. Tagirdzhanova-0007]|nr:MAG: methylglyoxal reductase (NADPH-dependent) gre2 [Cyphobasidiales sp. Tagirdzhanova-0007]